MKRIIEIITGEPLEPGERPGRIILTAALAAGAFYALLVIVFGLAQ